MKFWFKIMFFSKTPFCKPQSYERRAWFLKWNIWLVVQPSQFNRISWIDCSSISDYQKFFNAITRDLNDEFNQVQWKMLDKFIGKEIRRGKWTPVYKFDMLRASYYVCWRKSNLYSLIEACAGYATPIQQWVFSM